MEKIFIKELRLKTGLSQKKFADMYNIPLSTLKKWEQAYSLPPDYVVSLIAKTLPFCDDIYEKIIGYENDVYYLDRDGKRVSDIYGNWICFTEDIDGVMKRNIPVYFKELFDDFYKIQKKLNKDLMYDKIEKIEWR